MVADECMFCHEDLCILPFEYPGAKCKFMVEKEIVFECTATNEDLVSMCELCEYQPARGESPFEEYCEECAKVMAEDYTVEELRLMGYIENKGERGES